MADKRYYWFKMEQSFFEQKEIKYLRRLPGGDTYTIIYLKLILKSLENDGKIYYENIGDDYAQEWAMEIEEDEKAVCFLVAFLISKGLMIDCGLDEFEITKTKSLVGSETASAERKRRQREREREVSQLESVTLSQAGHTEKEIDIDKEIENRDKETDSNSLLSDYFKIFTKLAIKNNKLREAVKVEFLKLQDFQKEQAVTGARNYAQWYKHENATDSTGKYTVNAVNFIIGDKETFDDFQELPEFKPPERNAGGYI